MKTEDWGSVAPSKGITLAACACWLALLVGMAWHLTRGLTLWTFEEVRRADALSLSMVAPPTLLETSAGDARLAFSGSGTSSNAVYLVDFIYTRCEAVCRVLGVEFYQLQEQLRRSRANVQLLSISIDPTRDDSQALRGYAHFYKADSSHWTLARPTSMNAASSLHRSLRVIVIPDGFGGFVHNGAIHVIDSQHRLRAVFDYADWVSALAFAESLAGASPS